MPACYVCGSNKFASASSPVRVAMPFPQALAEWDTDLAAELGEI